ncbi:MAG: DNA polymerase III subunit chi [Nevskiales bacterium]|nr:DNA polymerase III subunit chi [Nevskiales bacterium]
MTSVDFYILPQTGGPADSAVMTACRLCEKAVGANRNVYVHSTDAAVSAEFDDALWSYRQGGFVAHERYDGHAAPTEPVPPVLIGAAEPPDGQHDILINLDAEVPPFFSRFERVIEIVAGHPDHRSASRAHYKFYRDRGYSLRTFEQDTGGAWKQRGG